MGVQLQVNPLRRLFSLVVLNLSFSPRVFAAGDDILDAASNTEIPVEISGRVVFVRTSINGQGPFVLIVDTGATETILT
ncbi:MAG: hypothetical protein ACUVWX_11890, partial [Kiritimatiellia bacterium]